MWLSASGLLFFVFFFFKAKTKHEQRFIHTYPLLAILTGLLIHNVWFLCSGKKLDRNETIIFPPQYPNDAVCYAKSQVWKYHVSPVLKLYDNLCCCDSGTWFLPAAHLLRWLWHSISAVLGPAQAAVAVSSTPAPWVG